MKPIPGYNDYFIDKHTNVWSIKPLRNSCIKPKFPRRMKKLENKDGYAVVSLRPIDKTVIRTIAYLMLITFVSSRPNGMIVLHGIRGKYDDYIDNLSWGTHAQNSQDKRRDGTQYYKLSELAVRIIRRTYSPYGKNGVSERQLAKIFNVCPTTINSIIHNTKWRYIL